MKVKMLQVLSGEKVFRIDTEAEFPDDEAISLINKGIAEPVNKTAYKKLLKKREEEKIAKEEDEKKAAAILYKEELEDERAKLQVRVDEITNALNDGAVYYKPYADLAEDLAKKENKDDDSSKGEGN